MKGQIRDNTILEDQDSELDNASDLSADALIYNYDVINLKEETSVYHNPIKDILDIYQKRTNAKDSKDYDSDNEFDPEKALQSNTLLAVDIQIWMKLQEPVDAIFVLAQDIAIFLYTEKKNMVVTPFKI